METAPKVLDFYERFFGILFPLTKLGKYLHAWILLVIIIHLGSKANGHSQEGFYEHAQNVYFPFASLLAVQAKMNETKVSRMAVDSVVNDWLRPSQA